MGLGMKEKKAILDEFARLTGYHRKSAVRVLNTKLLKQVMVYVISSINRFSNLRRNFFPFLPRSASLRW